MMLSGAEKNTDKLSLMTAPQNIAEVVIWLDQLLANTPAVTPLLTTQVLDQPKNNK